MSPAQPAAVAAAIMQARRAKHPVDAAALAGMLLTPDDAYTVQALVAQELQGSGAPFPRFWKSGGPSREAVLTHAPLPPEGVWASPADARSWPFNIRLIEVEIALRLAREVTPAQAAAMAQDATGGLVDAMAVSIEIVDSRWQQGAAAPALLKLADLQAHGALVLGEWVPFAQRDWLAQRCTVQIGSQPAVERRGTHSMGDPTWLLPAWLRHATREGQTVPAGTVVTTGTWCGMLPASVGDRVVARFDGIGEASVRL
jgi:2-keto-4-pentenoate hydratase